VRDRPVGRRPVTPGGEDVAVQERTA